MVALALAGVVTGAVRGAPRWLWLAAALMFLSVVLVISGVRFRMPVDPFLVMIGGAALAELGGPLTAARALWPRARARGRAAH